MSVSLANLLPDPLPEPSNDVLLDRFLEYTAGEAPRPLSGAGGGDPRAVRRQERHPQHADRFGQIAGGVGAAVRLARPRAAVGLHLPDQGARQREVDGAVPRVRSRAGGTLAPGTRPSTATRRFSAARPRSWPTSRCAKAPTPPSHDVVMDEFHYYADRDRGVAWQVPLLTMPQTRFLLMSATLGDTRFFEEALTRLNGRATVTVRLERSARAARVRVFRDPAGAYDREARRPRARRRSTSSTSRRPTPRGSAQDFTSLNDLHARGEGRHCGTASPGSRSPARTGPTSASGSATASACTTRGCCRSTACSSSSWPRRDC